MFNTQSDICSERHRHDILNVSGGHLPVVYSVHSTQYTVAHVIQLHKHAETD